MCLFEQVLYSTQKPSVRYIAFLANISTLSVPTQSLLLPPLHTHPKWVFDPFENSHTCWTFFIGCWTVSTIPISFSWLLVTSSLRYSPSSPCTSCVGQIPLCGPFIPCIIPVKLHLFKSGCLKTFSLLTSNPDYAKQVLQKKINTHNQPKIASGGCKTFSTPSFPCLYQALQSWCWTSFKNTFFFHMMLQGWTFWGLYLWHLSWNQTGC